MSERKQDWSKQAQRLYEYVKARPGEDLSAPELNKAAAGDGQYVASFTKRVSEVRQRAKEEGCEFIKSYDEWLCGQRRTWYRWVDSATALADTLESSGGRFDGVGSIKTPETNQNAPDASHGAGSSVPPAQLSLL